MLPSLAGIHSLAYRVVGYKNYEPLDKLMAAKLGQLDLPLTPVVKMKADSHCDAIVQISLFKAGINTIAELKVTQWVSLIRDPKMQVRAVTYSDKTYFIGHKPDTAIEQLTNEFVVDFLKANQKNSNTDKNRKASPVKDAGNKAKK